MRTLLLLGLAFGLAAAQDNTCDSNALVQLRGPKQCDESMNTTSLAECRLQNTLYETLDGRADLDAWENFKWKWNDETNRKELRTRDDMRNERKRAITGRMSTYFTVFLHLADKMSDKIEDLKAEKAKPDPWAEFFLQLSLGLLMCPVMGNIKVSELFSSLSDGAIKETVSQVTSLAQSTAMSTAMMGIKALVRSQLELADTAEKKFFKGLWEKQRVLLDSMSQNLGLMTDAQQLSLYVMFGPKVGSSSNIQQFIEEAYRAWEKQVKGLGWQWRRHGTVESEWVREWHGIIKVEMDVSEDWAKKTNKTAEAYEKLKKNPYIRIYEPRYSQWRDRLWLKAFVDEFVYPGSKDQDGVRHPQVDAGYIGHFTRSSTDDRGGAGCDGKCCPDKNKDCCTSCSQKFDKITFGEQFGKPAGHRCDFNYNCISGYCGGGGRRRSNMRGDNKICCMEEDKHECWGLSCGWCVDLPQGFPCDDADGQCAKGLKCKEQMPSVPGVKDITFMGKTSCQP